MTLDQPLDLLALAVAMSMLPAACVLVTSFTKIAVVFALVKNAIGIQQVPSTLVTNALALIVTLYVMAPVLSDVAANASNGPARGQSRIEWLSGAVSGPVGGFMKKHVDPREQERLIASAAQIWPDTMAKSVKPDDFFILAPAFAISELTAAFKIGFVLYLAFVAIDLIVANILMAMGMIMFSPTIVSIPLKIVLFALADGWSRLIQSLILTYR
ncbi:type III secretion apparatus protein, YscR/HrcR family [Burkholderia thailandensis MSMB121]|uniref:type III secretion system export apparatus subunit SctR n=1 Tax=Burkholderia humptydooensis TaxID=430531 RepID=UPI0003280FE5|nr:type III secretion system export apparatus subunit SctR [Burkholderia humptydooensis]AGK50528.1 type III secretion apparatus protein, YscR/HrcR family [Burkholderia thailandensis MSMB121]ATF32281.1 EscR/YscR/HrcR family type III secretion system export apparatus protein [Burkholderia thailandensis]KST72347.1 type III secretion system protein SsaR [Burkholderia humptydooensis]